MAAHSECVPWRPDRTKDLDGSHQIIERLVGVFLQRRRESRPPSAAMGDSTAFAREFIEQSLPVKERKKNSRAIPPCRASRDQREPHAVRLQGRGDFGDLLTEAGDGHGVNSTRIAPTHLSRAA